jgi:hypothetical protein
MKLMRLEVSILMLTVRAVTYGQSPGTAAAISDAQKNFAQMKTLAGTWQGSERLRNRGSPSRVPGGLLLARRLHLSPMWTSASVPIV